MKKAVGAAILLVSWLTQTLLFDYWAQKSDAYERMFSTIIHLSTTVRLAALPCVESSSKSVSSDKPSDGECEKLIPFRLLPYSLPKPDRDELENVLRQERQPTVGNLIWGVGLFLEEKVAKIDFWRSIFRLGYIALYLLGTVLVIYSELESRPKVKKYNEVGES